jgi:transcriptional regulator with XRE-family HTH domain
MGFEEDLARLMGKKDVSRSDLARKVGVSPQFITKILNGTNNYTLATMAKLARGISAVLEVRLADEESEVVRVVDPAVAVVIDAMRDLHAQSHNAEAEPVTTEAQEREPNIVFVDFESQSKPAGLYVGRRSSNPSSIRTEDYKVATGG